MFKQKIKGTVKVLALLLVLCMAMLPVSGGTMPVFADESLADLQQKQKELQSQKDETDKKLEALKDDITKKEQYRDQINEKIVTVQGQIDNLAKEITLLNKRIAAANEKISAKQESIDENFELLKQRLRALYMVGESSTLSMLLDSKSVVEYTQKDVAIKAVTKHDTQLIEMLSDAIGSIQADVDQINTDKEKLSNSKKEQDKYHTELTELYAQAQLLLAEAHNQEDAIVANSEQLGSKLEENEAAIKKLEEEIKKAAGGSTANLAGTGYEGTGNFAWPMPGYTYITCYYGDGGHRGIDVAGGSIYGKAIVASDSGYISYAGWNDSYGYCVFIDHGNGYETRYAHMSALGTTTGAYVNKQAVIGYVGSTGNSTGPHLHFEIILGGATTNPFNYF